MDANALLSDPIHVDDISNKFTLFVQNVTYVPTIYVMPHESRQCVLIYETCKKHFQQVHIGCAYMSHTCPHFMSCYMNLHNGVPCAYCYII